MTEPERTYRTKSGRVLTDADIEALADEAERGYDVSHLKARQDKRYSRPVPPYRHMVDVQGDGSKYRKLYDGTDAADAMAAWSAAIQAGEEYVTLESLRETRGQS